ncbi:adenosylmethionine--8-amino-7-oxononanoate transaminase [Gluconobacter kanchanaburiensis]|uniref:Adenosylmethionine-8-amino-7-oxononanoate aminotransferase n=1 Tax=Gluconobacter kanchanaburiensis NBRC 103587 TaxID=1307948 RepID=A0A511B8P1_9PROT|nr:adenosylmethionine--8-amino-7-oxononanoate transaminase [Gluconobacter kanchanaburiensis]MBF0862073.1 adenosylmethionine--8-amino-7-oxononanoate transaminase [Gluconobacter kanchanaburiensis]GBR71146.1 adenosylmethionine-8-amino-7-oxononanoate aminotransferase [Gluconobacter kanchanaburiensis NBRC 103587]GEK96816.1 adenosylmethionine--8-amino-7-oxononanoate aminotransferase BioA [Gluconobacter kanchanaburiensis NBRC 103587]
MSSSTSSAPDLTAASRTAADLPHLWLPYTQMQTAPFPVEAVRTSCSRITLADGRELVDGVAAWWTACHGYSHPHIHEALIRQAERMPHVMFGGMVHEPAIRLAARLAAMLPGDLERVFFTDSGSVAMEVAIKMAVQYHINLGTTGRTKILSFRGGYHGDTLGMMSICDPEEGMHSLFAGVLPNQVLADLPVDADSLARLEALLAERGDSIAAMVTEPLVQGAGGMLFHDPEVLQRLRELCDRHGILLILDEIFTGFGRTGTMFACEQAGIVPDIVALSKALTGGTMALAATVARRHVFEAFLSDSAGHALMHGPTFMANPLACAVANASLDLFESEPRLEQIAAISAQLTRELEPCRTLPGMKDVRVLGAIGVVELESLENPDALRRAFVERGVWIRPFRNIVYLTPAFTITPEELTRLTAAIIDVLREGT